MGPDKADSGAATRLADSAGAAQAVDAHPAFTRRLIAKRREKDEFFASSPHSSLSSDRRRTFWGLAHFPPDASCRLAASGPRS